MTLEFKTDHAETALARLPQVLQDKPKLTAIIEAFIAPLQELESVFQDLYVNRRIDTAVGAQLDQLGDIVGQPRAGELDEVYRRKVRARVAASRSNGTVEDVITVARLIIGDDDAYLQADRQGVATLVLRVRDFEIDADLAALLLSFLQDTIKGGDRIILEWQESPTADLFQFDAGPGYDQGRYAGATG